MKLIAIKATESTPNSIEVFDNKDNRFASINKFGDLKVFGEDSTIDSNELKLLYTISINFELFFTNINYKLYETITDY